ncbi:hypothetical protein HMPREF9999_02113 [Alloprevotella sp. oral taxon 473 str. F0040]|nr:hypothetical protein HMPREF9999_02113 [Alloprevotella sp. oral taxon 473 str. F0040]
MKGLNSGCNQVSFLIVFFLSRARVRAHYREFALFAFTTFTKSLVIV